MKVFVLPLSWNIGLISSLSEGSTPEMFSLRGFRSDVYSSLRDRSLTLYLYGSVLVEPPDTETEASVERSGKIVGP